MTRIEHDTVRTPVPGTTPGMLQVQTCVSIHCAHCGDALGDPGFEAHYPTETAALDAAAAQGWQVGPGGRWWCSACGPMLICAAEGHELTGWITNLVGRAYRYCRRCCRHESRLGGGPSDAPSASSTTGAGTDVVGEVA